jgi:hypothetical protein
MADKTTITLPLLRLGRLELDPALRALQPGSAASGLVVTATVAVPGTPTDRPYAWEVAWADAAREAERLGADHDTAQALAVGGGKALSGGTRVVVAAHGEVLLARWLQSGAGASSVRVGSLPHLQEAAAAAARRPAYVVVLADRDGTDIIAHASGDQRPAMRFSVGRRPGAQRDPHPDRPAHSRRCRGSSAGNDRAGHHHRGRPRAERARHSPPGRSPQRRDRRRPRRDHRRGHRRGRGSRGLAC